jgi:chaperonin GroEL
MSFDFLDENGKHTKIVFGNEARKQLLAGLETAAQAVGATMGPKGKCVIIQRDGQVPVVTKDGVTVSKSINLKSPIARMGADLIKESASRTNDSAGDGTTTATVLTHAMVKEGHKLLSAGYDAKLLRSGVEIASKLVVEKLKELSKAVDSEDEVAQVGTISANGDTEIGKLLSQAMLKVGRDGIITVEDAKGMMTTLDVVDGMQFERGYLSPYFVTNSEKMHALYENVCVLLTDKKLSNLQEIVPVLEQVSQSQRPLLIIADDIEGQALQLLIVNKLKGGLPVVAIKAPGHGHLRDAILQDIATLAGSVVVSSTTGVSFKDLRVPMLGNLKKVVVDAKSSTLVGNGTTVGEVQKRTEELRSQLLDVALTQEEREVLRMRIAKLSSGVAVIKVGGSTELETTEKKYRIEDALNATRAAVEEGIVPGGGSALLNALRSLRADPRMDGPGQGIVLKACEAPIRQIVANVGDVSADVILNRLTNEPTSFGYNAATGNFEDLLQAGVIDPVKVTRTALENASSVAITFLSLDAVIVEDTEK